jgi:hypothetical protein
MHQHLKANLRSSREDGRGSPKIERKLKEHALGVEKRDASG